MKRPPLLPKPRASKEALRKVSEKQSDLVAKVKALEARIKTLESKEKARGANGPVELPMPGVTSAGNPDLVQDSLRAIWQEIEGIHQRLDSLLQVEGGQQHD